MNFGCQSGCCEVLEELSELIDFLWIGMQARSIENRRYRPEVRQHETQNVCRVT